MTAIYAPSHHFLGSEDFLTGPHIYKGVYEPGFSVELGLVLTKVCVCVCYEQLLSLLLYVHIICLRFEQIYL